MEVAIRKKRTSTTPSTGLPTHTSSLAAEYNDHVNSSSAIAASSSSSAHGLKSSSVRGSFGSSATSRRLHTLSFYNDAPQEEISLDQFERAGVDRLQALKSMETARLKRGALSKNAVGVNDPNENPFTNIITKYEIDKPAWDNLSHFVLRLAYCRTEELRRWLIQQESALFKYRFDSEQEEVIVAFLRDNDLNYQPIDDDELNTIIPHENQEDDRMHTTVLLKDLLRQVPYTEPNQTVYYKVPFEDAIDLLQSRKVYLSQGFAYVSRNNLSAIITTKFRSRLSQALGLTLRSISQIKQDQRIQPMLNMLSKQYITPSYKTGKVEGAVTKEQLPILAERSMPLCMNTLYNALKAENHLKHGGRMQLGLFLKGIGLSLNDALAFWKQSFARRTPPEKFDKEYAYNIRHNYGKEGKRTTYTPYGCIKIIQSTPGPGDHHGCPFRQFEETTLRTKMRHKNFTAPQQEEIMTLVKGQHYQVACQRWYQFTHGNQLGDNVGNHPNAYFDVSETWWREQEKTVEGMARINGTPSSTSSQATSQASAASNSSGSTTGGGYNAFGSSTAAASSHAAAPSSTPPAADAATTSEPTPMEVTPSDAPAAVAVAAAE